MAKERVSMLFQDSKVRQANFEEVALGYTPELAIEEAQRCLECKNPRCSKGCPVSVRIPNFIGQVKKGDFKAAYASLSQDNCLPAVCGRVCPQEEQCEKLCVVGIKHKPVAIGNLERFVADWAAANLEPDAPPAIEPDAAKVAVVGSGPAGLTCAGELARKGYNVTIFEAFHAPGGVLMYGIPEFRLPKALVRREVLSLQRMGVDLQCNVVVGRSVTVDELFEEGYKAVFIGSGAGLPSFMNIPGEQLPEVMSANEYLTRINLMGAWRSDSLTPITRAKKVAVIGGGNVAMDAARCAKRLGAEVTIVYRRTVDEMPARKEEIHHALEEDINVAELSAPIEVLGSETLNVRGLRCQRMALGEPDEKGRRGVKPIPGDEFEIETDLIIVAIGTSPNPLIRSTTPGLDTNKWGCLVATEEGLTSRENVWAGGDAVTGAATVILAMGAGKRAAAAIDEKLSAK